MKKWLKVLIAIIIVLILIPIPMMLKDGGTVVYSAVLYQVVVWHQINPEATEYDKNGHYIGTAPQFLTGTSFYFFPNNFKEKEWKK